MAKQKQKPLGVMMSARANVFYLQHAKVCQDGDRVVYLSREGNLDRVFNIPEKNTAFILLGKGTSITDAAARKLADAGVLVGFCGSGGSPLFSSVSHVFLEHHSEYRPTEYMQAWIGIWMDEDSRLSLAKQFLLSRIEWTKEFWLKIEQIQVSDSLIDVFKNRISVSKNTMELLTSEAEWAKGLYAQLARHYKVSDFVRREGDGAKSDKVQLINSLLDHGNYIAYGYAGTVLSTLGISYAFPLLHGKTRRGALVFDVADLFKDGIVMMLAFKLGSKGITDQDFRGILIEQSWEMRLLDKLFDLIKGFLK